MRGQALGERRHKVRSTYRPCRLVRALGPLAFGPLAVVVLALGLLAFGLVVAHLYLEVATTTTVVSAKVGKADE